MEFCDGICANIKWVSILVLMDPMSPRSSILHSNALSH